MLYAPFNLISGNYNIDPLFLTVYKFREASIRSRQEFQINFLSFFSHNTNPIFVFRLLLFGRKGIEKFWKIDRRIQFLEKSCKKILKEKKKGKILL